MRPRSPELTQPGSTKGASGAPLARYVGGHPMAGRERSGAIAAQADLFEGRPWVVVPHAQSETTSAVSERIYTIHFFMRNPPKQEIRR